MNKPIPLSPIDHIFTGNGSYPIEFVFVYNGRIDPERLEESLKDTIVHFPPISSTIKKDADGAFAFEPVEEGYSLEVVDLDIDFGQTEKREIFLNPVTTKVGEILTKIKLTNTPSGTVLGVSISHAIVDGFSYFYFLSNWARNFNQLDVFPVSHDRNLLINPTPDCGSIRPQDILNKAGLYYGKAREEIKRDALVWENVHLSTAQLKSTLAEAQKECESRLSFNDVIVATLWKKYIEDWSKDDHDRPVFISCPYDYRRLMKDLPNFYFGNAVALATATLSFNELLDSSLGKLAMIIRKNIAKINEQYIFGGLEALTCLRKEAGLSAFEHVHVADPENGLLVTNLSRLPVDKIEFGAGPPIKYEILTAANRGAVILPDDDGLQVRVCCPIS